MKPSTLAMATAVALSLSASLALAQEAGFGGAGDVSKNQIPGPNPSGNATDPAAGNPGSRAQVPTDPNKQEELYGRALNGAASGEEGEALPPAPPPQ